MTTKKSEDGVIKSNNGFSFKRKRQDGPVNENPIQQLKKEGDKISKDKPPVQISLKKSSLTKDLIRNTFSENDPPNNQEPEPQTKKIVQMNAKNKEQKKSINKILKDKNDRDDSSDSEEQEETQSKESPPTEIVLSKELINPEKSLVKLPPYPLVLLPLEFEIEVYEKENPYKRLSLMVTDISSKEEALLKIEFKDYTFFLKILEKFVKRLSFDVNRMVEKSILEKESSNKVLKENIQNVFERQKKRVIEKLIQEYMKGSGVLQEFQEVSLNKGKLSETVESYVQYIKYDNRLLIDTTLSRRLEAQRDEMGKKITQKIKSSMQDLSTHEKQMASFQKEIDALEFKFEQQKKKAYNKVFKEYIPIFESDPADLMRNFLIF